MSKHENTHRLDPLIFGPQLDALEARLARQNTSLKKGDWDLESTSPFFDFWIMLTKPQKFFLSLHRLPEGATPWIWIKAILGAVMAVWVESFSTSRAWISLAHSNVFHQGNSQIFSYLESRLEIPQLAEKLKVVMVLLSQFHAISAPVLAISQIVLATGLLILGLRWVGIPWSRIFFPKLLLLGVYLKFFFIFSLIPGVGSFLSYGLNLLFGVIAVSYIFQISKWKSALAYFFVSFLVAETLSIFALLLLLLAVQVF